jgi:hypothetical protein
MNCVSHERSEIILIPLKDSLQPSWKELILPHPASLQAKLITFNMIWQPVHTNHQIWPIILSSVYTTLLSKYI